MSVVQCSVRSVAARWFSSQGVQQTLCCYMV